MRCPVLDASSCAASGMHLCYQRDRLLCNPLLLPGMQAVCLDVSAFLCSSQTPFPVEPPSIPVNRTGGCWGCVPCVGCYLGTGTLMEDSFMPVAMSHVPPCPGSSLGMQQKKRLCCPGILSIVSCLSFPYPSLRTGAAHSATAFINGGALKGGRLLLQRLLAVTPSPFASPSEAMAAGAEIH